MSYESGHQCADYDYDEYAMVDRRCDSRDTELAEDGKYYCWCHHPVQVAAEQARVKAIYDAEWAELNERAAAKNAEKELLQEMKTWMDTPRERAEEELDRLGDWARRADEICDVLYPEDK